MRDERKAKKILVLDGKYFPMNKLSRRKAIKAVVNGRAFIIDPKTFEKITNVYSVFEVIMFPNAHTKILLQTKSKKHYGRGILSRDKHKCGYCLKKANTVDHIIPQAQGGSDNWDNLVACCLECNQKKGNRTPEQSGMELLFKPKSSRQDLMDSFEETFKGEK